MKQRCTWVVLSVALAGSVAWGGAQAQPAAVEAGEEVFKKCRACHRIGEGAQNSVGPVLNGVIGRQAGTVPGYTYSQINAAAGANGLVWTEEAIFDYLTDPNEFLTKFLTSKGKADQASGRTKMVFKLADEGERRAVIAYVKSFSR